MTFDAAVKRRSDRRNRNRGKFSPLFFLAMVLTVASSIGFLGVVSMMMVSG